MKYGIILHFLNINKQKFKFNIFPEIVFFLFC